MGGLIANVKFRAIIAGITVLFVTMGLFAMLIYLGSAVYLGYALILIPPLAALAAAATALLFCIFVVMFARMMVRGAEARAAKNKPASPEQATGQMGEMLGAKAHELFQQRPGMGIAASLAAGFAVGMSPKLRSMLRDALFR
jgi:hypothetical protein